METSIQLEKTLFPNVNQNPTAPHYNNHGNPTKIPQTLPTPQNYTASYQFTKALIQTINSR
jgi:hypothetical protein